MLKKYTIITTLGMKTLFEKVDMCDVAEPGPTKPRTTSYNFSVFLSISPPNEIYFRGISFEEKY